MRLSTGRPKKLKFGMWNVEICHHIVQLPGPAVGSRVRTSLHGCFNVWSQSPSLVEIPRGTLRGHWWSLAWKFTESTPSAEFTLETLIYRPDPSGDARRYGHHDPYVVLTDEEHPCLLNFHLQRLRKMDAKTRLCLRFFTRDYKINSRYILQERECILRMALY